MMHFHMEGEMLSLYMDYISERDVNDDIKFSELERSAIDQELEIRDRYAITKIEECIDPNILHDYLKTAINDIHITRDLAFYNLFYAILSISSYDTLSGLLGVIKYADVESNISYHYYNVTKTAIIEQIELAGKSYAHYNLKRKHYNRSLHKHFVNSV